MEEFIYEERIPLDRVGVLIGKKGKTKREIQGETGVKLNIDSKEGIVKIIGEDPLKVFSAREIVRAIANGFNPDIAKLLLKQDYMLEVINIKEFAKTKNAEIRLKGRVIGERGKSRANIERLTNCHISVYDKTISIIGQIGYIELAKKAVVSLLRGKTHGSVYSKLEKRRRMIRLAEKLGIDPHELKTRQKI